MIRVLASFALGFGVSQTYNHSFLQVVEAISPKPIASFSHCIFRYSVIYDLDANRVIENVDRVEDKKGTKKAQIIILGSI